MRKESIKRLLVRAPNWIGDAVMCEPAQRRLRSLFPQAELTLLAKGTVAELFVGYPGLNRVLVYDDKGAPAGLAERPRKRPFARQTRIRSLIVIHPHTLQSGIADDQFRDGTFCQEREFRLREAGPEPALRGLAHYGIP